MLCVISHLIASRGTDWAPGKESIANEPIPKSAARILNAVKIQGEFKASKRKRGEEAEKKGAAKRKKLEEKRLKIMPGESIQHFNRCGSSLLRLWDDSQRRFFLAV